MFYNFTAQRKKRKKNSAFMPGGSLHHATVSAQNGKTKGESIKTDIGLEGMKNEKNGHLIAVTCISG